MAHQPPQRFFLVEEGTPRPRPRSAHADRAAELIARASAARGEALGQVGEAAKALLVDWMFSAQSASSARLVEALREALLRLTLYDVRDDETLLPMVLTKVCTVARSR